MQKKIEEERVWKEQNKKIKQDLHEDFVSQIKIKEVAKKYEKLFEQNLEKQLLVCIVFKLYYYIFKKAR